MNLGEFCSKIWLSHRAIADLLEDIQRRQNFGRVFHSNGTNRRILIMTIALQVLQTTTRQCQISMLDNVDVLMLENVY